MELCKELPYLIHRYTHEGNLVANLWDINLWFCSNVYLFFFSSKWTSSFNGKAQQEISTDENTSDKIECEKAERSHHNLGFSAWFNYDTVQLTQHLR